ncbi:MAG: 30S ribosomal protein S6 [Minisyncoccia bacterium]
MLENENVQAHVGDTNRYYEIGFIITPSIEEANVQTVSTEIAGLIAKVGGNVIDGEEPKLRRLAYPMYKVIGGQKIAATTGYFGWTKFEIDQEKSAEGVQSIEKALKTIEEILRSLVIKTVKEKTYTPREPEPMEMEADVIAPEEIVDVPEEVDAVVAADDSREGEVVEETKEE